MISPDELEGTLNSLQGDLANNTLGTNQRYASLEKLKVLSRQQESLSTLSRKESIELLCQYGLDLNGEDGAIEALRCLANVLFQKSDARQTLVDLEYPPKLVTKLAVATPQEEFVCSRILFLLTYETTVDFDALVLGSKLDEAILEKLQKHAVEATKAENLHPDSLEVMGLSETLRLLFNITAMNPNVIRCFDPATPYVLDLLQKQPQVSRYAMEGAVGPLINVLLNIRLELTDEGTKKTAGPESLFEMLVDILDVRTRQNLTNTLDDSAVSIIALLQKIYVGGRESLRKIMKGRLLPTDSEREKPLGKSDTLFARLMKLSTSAEAPNLRNLISGLMFELSDKEPATFVRNLGYGYASGFLMNNQIDASGIQKDFEAQRYSSEASESRGFGNSSHFNFVTGQYWKDEPQDERPEMTEDEKLREAEKLFVLFERLKQTGVIDVENPVETAAREGRFEEVD